MIVWRICPARDARAAFDGEGARRYGGRWNRKGTAVVYTSSALSLAALELFVHVEPGQAPRPLWSFRATVPDAEVEALEPSRLPRTWRDFPAPEATQEIGSRWAERAASVALSVPSAVVPGERNVLLNPLHPRFRSVRVGDPAPFSFDPRMWKRRPA